MNRTAPVPAYYQSARLWAPRTRFGGVEWRCLPRGAVLPWEKLRELRFLCRLAFIMATVPAPILFLSHLF